MTKLNQPS